MKHVKSYIEYISESYLTGSKQPLYHCTSRNKIVSILTSDILKCGKPSFTDKKDKDGKDMKSISLTRSIMFGGNRDIRIVLDSDKLSKFGYKHYPIDEFGISKKSSTDPVRKASNSHLKWNFLERDIKHNIPTLPEPKISEYEVEYEERFFKDIVNLGKYIISIQININNIDLINDIELVDELQNYLDKYPHIILETFESGTFKKPKTLLISDFKIKSYQNK